MVWEGACLRVIRGTQIGSQLNLRYSEKASQTGVISKLNVER